MGDIEVIFGLITVIVISFIIYTIINSVTFRDLFKRFGVLKPTRRDFYECGFRPKPQRPVQISMQFVIICVFFILYDIELTFLLPYVAGFSSAALGDSFLFFLFFFLFFISIVVDFERHALYWQY